jgi:hypothetical protein
MEDRRLRSAMRNIRSSEITSMLHLFYTNPTTLPISLTCEPRQATCENKRIDATVPMVYKTRQIRGSSGTPSEYVP